MAKRIFFFILTNVLVLTTISIIFMVTGAGNYIEDGGINFGALLVFSAIVGFTGSFISLLMSRWMAKKMMNVKVIDPDGPMNSQERQIVEIDRKSVV